MIDEVPNIERVEEDLNRLIERRAKGVNHANEEARYWADRDRRRNHAAQLVNAKAWAAFHGGRALHHHDLAAQAARRRDEALALVEELEGGRVIPNG